MASKKAYSTTLVLPTRHWAYRASLAGLVVVSSALIIMSKTGNPAVQRLRGAMADTLVPMLEVAARPVDAVMNVGSWVSSWAGMHDENMVLKSQNAELLKWQAAAKAMQAENASLRELLNVVPDQSEEYITAKVVSDISGPFVHSALINGGTDNGISKDQAVMSQHGLIGRVVEANKGSARVLLLTDINSRIPVIAEHAKEKSILAGNNTSLPTLSYLFSDSKIAVGERIVTSGDGGMFPKGLPVGVVTSVDKGVIQVQPYADAGMAQFVSVIAGGL